MAALAAGDDNWAIDPAIDEVIAAARPRKLRIEIIRFPSGSTKLLVVAHGDALPALAERDGFTRKTAASSVRLERDDEYILVMPEETGALCEWHAMVPAIAPEDAVRFLASLPALEPFEAIARPVAFVRSFGIEISQSAPPRALLAVNRDLDRLEDDETSLLARGFVETEDEGLWIDGEGRSLVWMGRTLYGYLGEVPESVGGF